jgi:protoporphyrinogen oxidase
MNPTRTAVVGGRMLGLTVALRLAQQGDAVTVLEGAPEVGGLASAWSVGDVHWDRHYHVTLASDAHLRAVLVELGLDDEIRWETTSTGYYAGGDIHPVSGPIDFLRLPPLTVVDKARLALTLAYGTLIRNGRRMEGIGVDDWLVRWSGRSTYEKFWLPLLRAKLGENHRHASAAFIWATIQRLTRARRNGAAEERFGYVPGGYGHVLEVFVKHLIDHGVEVRTGQRVTRVAGGDPVVVSVDAAPDREFDRAVVTVAAPLAARLVEPLTPTERGRLERVRMQGIVCASLVLDRPLTDHYLTYITDLACPFTAVVDMSALVEAEALGGRGLVYLPKYVDPADPLFDVADEAIVDDFVAYLAQMYPGLGPERILASRVSRVRHVMAIATENYSDGLPPMRLATPNVHLANSAHLVNATLNVDETVALAERTVADL